MEPLNTLQTPDDPSAVIKLFKGKSILFPFKLVVYVKNPVASEQAKVTRFNLTFAGDYDGSTSYVVHALNTPLLLPPGTFSTFDKFLFSLRTTTFYSARYFRPFIKKALKGNTAATVRPAQAGAGPRLRCDLISWRLLCASQAAADSVRAAPAKPIHPTAATPCRRSPPGPLASGLHPPWMRPVPPPNHRLCSSSCRWTRPGRRWAKGSPSCPGPATSS
jgi:hypothetical protein